LNAQLNITRFRPTNRGGRGGGGNFRGHFDPREKQLYGRAGGSAGPAVSRPACAPRLVIDFLRARGITFCARANPDDFVFRRWKM
jgi:hypothetical protein